MTSHVLTGTDGSARSEAAALWAAEEAVRRGVGLRILHAWPWLSADYAEGSVAGDLRPAALAALAGTAERIRHAHPGLSVETAVVGNDPVDALVAEAEGAELLVLGSRGLGGFAGLLVGSVGLAVAARVATPLVMVRADANDTPQADAPDRRDVVVGVDARHPADAVLDFAFAEAARRRVRLRAVHGWDVIPAWSAAGWVPPQVDATTQEASEQAALDEALAQARAAHPDVEVVATTRLGGAANAVVTAAADACLVVVGRRDPRHHPLGRWLGPVAHAALHHAAAPVAVVPHG
ncbi:universal stress protein [Streptomyces sp. FH025]|uniref:universal stress protein n=1 Tax=Streptomyces sp. FH025 TaxID=2815937 RepID=UPI001A9CCA78|nr:universal stress protein [Streptomyces sp. FH025]MBO1413141.1 universal stress protein [Streptomyces sp. FH025]